MKQGPHTDTKVGAPNKGGVFGQEWDEKYRACLALLFWDLASGWPCINFLLTEQYACSIWYIARGPRQSLRSTTLQCTLQADTLQFFRCGFESKSCTVSYSLYREGAQLSNRDNNIVTRLHLWLYQRKTRYKAAKQSWNCKHRGDNKDWTLGFNKKEEKQNPLRMDQLPLMKINTWENQFIKRNDCLAHSFGAHDWLSLL